MLVHAPGLGAASTLKTDQQTHEFVLDADIIRGAGATIKKGSLVWTGEDEAALKQAKAVWNTLGIVFGLEPEDLDGVSNLVPGTEPAAGIYLRRPRASTIKTIRRESFLTTQPTMYLPRRSPWLTLPRRWSPLR